MEKREKSRMLTWMRRVAAAGLAGCLFAVMCPPINVSASETITRENFDYVRYADDYQDLKEAFGYDVKALYNHYLNNGIAEGRIAYRTDGGAIGNQAGADNASTAAKTEQTNKKVLTPQEQKLVDEGWEWNSNWGMWVR